MTDGTLVCRTLGACRVAVVAVIALGCGGVFHAATFLATTSSEIQNLTDDLQAGDTLLIAPGTYDMDTWNIRNLVGTPGEWIHIRPQGGPVHIRGVAANNVINVSNVRYVVIQDLEITYSGTTNGVDGIKFRGGTSDHHVVLNGLHIHDVTGVGINSKADQASFLDISRCHIHDTDATGEGIYLGCHPGDCWVYDTVVRGNWVHDTHGDQGDGIEIKRGSYRTIIEDNVVYRTAGYPGITLYRSDRGTVEDNNIVRRNVVWQAVEGIFASAETTIENNVVFDCTYCINTRNYGDWGVSDLIVRNNTVFSCGSIGLILDNWDVGTGRMVARNNAIFQENMTDLAIDADDGIGVATIEGNRHHGVSEVAGSTAGLSPASEFASASVTPGVVDLYPAPGASLIDTGAADPEVGEDFNRSPRPSGASAPDVGAYEVGPVSNPGWQISESFKPLMEDGGPYPVPDGAATPGRPMTVRRVDASTYVVEWDVSSCRSWNYHLLFGSLAAVANFALTEGYCYLGNQGSAAFEFPGSGADQFFVIVGAASDRIVGGHGFASDGTPRPAGGVGLCAVEAENGQICP